MARHVKDLASTVAGNRSSRGEKTVTLSDASMVYLFSLAWPQTLDEAANHGGVSERYPRRFLEGFANRGYKSFVSSTTV